VDVDDEREALRRPLDGLRRKIQIERQRSIADRLLVDEARQALASDQRTRAVR